MPNLSRYELQAAILGASGDFFGTLPPTTREAALDVIIEATEKVYVLRPKVSISIAVKAYFKTGRYILVFTSGIVGLLSAAFMNVSSPF